MVAGWLVWLLLPRVPAVVGYAFPAYLASWNVRTLTHGYWFDLPLRLLPVRWIWLRGCDVRWITVGWIPFYGYVVGCHYATVVVLHSPLRCYVDLPRWLRYPGCYPFPLPLRFVTFTIPVDLNSRY